MGARAKATQSVCGVRVSVRWGLSAESYPCPRSSPTGDPPSKLDAAPPSVLCPSSPRQAQVCSLLPRTSPLSTVSPTAAAGAEFTAQAPVQSPGQGQPGHGHGSCSSRALGADRGLGSTGRRW